MKLAISSNPATEKSTRSTEIPRKLLLWITVFNLTLVALMFLSDSEKATNLFTISIISVPINIITSVFMDWVGSLITARRARKANENPFR